MRIEQKKILRYTRLKYLKNLFLKWNQKNAVFIWIPKNAGSSIYYSLENYGFSRYISEDAIKYEYPNRGLVSFGHVSISEAIKRNLIPRPVIDEAFKFCVVRNPIDRAVSLFNYHKKIARIEKGASFLDFLKLIEKNIEEIGIYNSVGLSLCNPQTEWIKEVGIDFILKFENLEDDYKILLDRLEIEQHQLPKLNKSFSSGKDSLNKTELDLIEKIYRQDFLNFDY